MKITIAAVNLQSGVATTKGRSHYALTGWKYWLPHSDNPIREAGKMLRREGVDIACINEITERSLRSGFRSQTDILAESAGMIHRHFYSSQMIGKLFFHEGNAILSRSPIIRADSHLLHREFNMRMALEEATIGISDAKITVFVAHLALTRKHRAIQIRQIIDIIKDKNGPMILAGDFNEREPKAFDILLRETPLKHRCTLKTFPSWDPKYPFDYVFLSKEFSVLECHVQKSPAFSDHLALVVETELGYQTF